MKKKVKVSLPTLYIEGNNGGDYLRLKPLGDNLVQLEIGNCCVVTISQVVPVEFITAALTDVAVRYSSIESAIIGLWKNAGEDYCNKLIACVGPLKGGWR